MTDGAGGPEGGGAMDVPSGGPYISPGLYPTDWSYPYGIPIGHGAPGTGTTTTPPPNPRGTNGRCTTGRGLKGSGAYIRMKGDAGTAGRGLTCPSWCPSPCPFCPERIPSASAGLVTTVRLA